MTTWHRDKTAPDGETHYYNEHGYQVIGKMTEVEGSHGPRSVRMFSVHLHGHGEIAKYGRKRDAEIRADVHHGALLASAAREAEAAAREAEIDASAATVADRAVLFGIAYPTGSNLPDRQCRIISRNFQSGQVLVRDDTADRSWWIDVEIPETEDQAQAIRSDQQMRNFATDAYMSRHYDRERPTRSHEVSMLIAKRALVDEAHAEALAEESPIRVGDLFRHTGNAELIRARFHAGLYDDTYNPREHAARSLMANHEVTRQGAELILSLPIDQPLTALA